MLIEKRDIYIKTYMGADYKIGHPKTVGELKAALQEIIDDLPEEDHLKISSVNLRKDTLEYTLEEGIVDGPL